MKEEEILKNKFGTTGGFKVPDNYFENFALEISEKLPEYPAKPEVQPLSTWQRLKPYVYMAAMFAGIWCMVNMYHRVTESHMPMNLDNPPAMISQAMSEPEISEMYLRSSAKTEYELVDEACSEYSSIEEFEKDFGYKLDDEYRDIKM